MISPLRGRMDYFEEKFHVYNDDKSFFHDGNFQSIHFAPMMGVFANHLHSQRKKVLISSREQYFPEIGPSKAW
ncbi:hypothetical protein C5167_044644 [Papaver somniferum]|uniref:Uncharacterized protein n=1 Tax=Papaver somniferum TaxID=3469 RepID=A0A4Y7LC26_PAPSO|nr:hypothetical protein C5167_044644 [Papaver somniferum]